MPKIKICGLTSIEETAFLKENQVDFAGVVVFFPKSKRNVSIEHAIEIINALDPSIHSVAVTVSPCVEEIKQIEQAGFHYLQVHGELAEDVLNSAKIPIFRAFNISNVSEYSKLHHCSKIHGYVFDAQEPGSGKIFDWSTVKSIPRDEKLFILAGGLTPQNVASAVNFVKPDVVDVSSGVENDSGKGKDPEKIVQFVQNARKTLSI